MIFETVKTINDEREIKRLKTSFILLCGVAFIPLGIYLLLAYEMMFGATLVITLSPCFLLYPLVRFFLFGGRDSIAGIVTTVIVEEVVKSKIADAFKDRKKK